MTVPVKIGISLDLINRHYQEPNRNRYESKYFWEELYPLIATAGFNGIEIPYEPIWMFGGRSGVPMTRYCVTAKYKDVHSYVEHLKNSGIEKVAGIHFDPSLFMRNENLDFYFGASKHFAGEAIRYAGEIGADYLTLTPTPSYGLVQHYHGNGDNWAGQFIARTADLVNELAAIARESGVTLSLRNEYWSLLRGDRLIEFIAKIDDAVRIDIDSAHAAITGQDPAARAMEHAARLGSVHLTDTAFVDDAEVWKMVNPEFPQTRATQVFRDLGQGNVDLKAFYQALASVNYSGWAIVSCHQTRDPMRALLRCRHHIDNHILNQ